MFEEQKKKALTGSSGAILTLMNYLMTVCADIDNGHADTDRQKLFKQFMQVNEVTLKFLKYFDTRKFYYIHGSKQRRICSCLYEI